MLISLIQLIMVIEVATILSVAYLLSRAVRPLGNTSRMLFYEGVWACFCTMLCTFGLVVALHSGFAKGKLDWSAPFTVSAYPLQMYGL